MEQPTTEKQLVLNKPLNKQELLAICEQLSAGKVTKIVWDGSQSFTDTEQIIRAIGKGNALTNVLICNQDWSREVALQFFEALKHVELVSLSIEDVAIGSSVSVLAQTCKKDSLVSLTLDGCEIDDDGVDVILSVLELGSLTHLSLSRNLITVEGIHHLSNVFKFENKLQVLKLGGNELSDEGIIELVGFFALDYFAITELNLSRNGLGILGMKSLARALQHGKSIKILDLSHNKFTDEAIVMLIECLPIHVQKVNIDECPVSTKTKSQLELLLKKNAEMQELEERVKFASFSYCTASFGRRTT